MTIDPQVPLKTITSSVESSRQLSTQTAKADPAKNQAIAAAIVRLASHYFPKDFAPEQAKYLALDFIEDLQDFTIADIDNACADYRRNAKNKKFPTPGALLEILTANRKHRLEMAKIGDPVKYMDSRPTAWWMQRRSFWKPHWRESDVSPGELVRDEISRKLREPERV